MGAFVTLLAALGGAVMGVGIGLAISHRRTRQLANRLQKTDARLRSTVIPLLERRAQQLGIPRERRASEATNPTELAAQLAAAIRDDEDQHGLPWSDTLEAPTDAMSGERTRPKGAKGRKAYKSS